ncbi:hypothetical protein [Rudaea sp.]|uniref:hypothetical protein n=1 Tax=Rudaea sp. TaxID=2136325 RepID=UPI00321FD1DC
MEQTTLWVLVLSGVLVLLGFIALLLTKIYAVSGTGETVVDFGILGKMKSNYPALVFVAIGGALSMYAVKTNGEAQHLRSQLEKDLAPVDWLVTGQIVLPADAPKDTLQLGTVDAVPEASPFFINQDGTFELHVKIPHGVDFEKAIQTIAYTSAFGSFQIDPAAEFAKFVANPNESLLQKKEDEVRKYKPVTVVRSSQ